jgi:hypothetical protein
VREARPAVVVVVAMQGVHLRVKMTPVIGDAIDAERRELVVEVVALSEIGVGIGIVVVAVVVAVA